MSFVQPMQLRIVFFSHIVSVQEFRNTFYLVLRDSYSPDLTDRNAYFNSIASKMKDCVTSNDVFYQASWEGMDDQGEWQPYALDSYNVVGTRSTPSCPLTVAGVVIGKTQKRRTFGRKFLGPISVADQTAGVPSATLTANLATVGYWWSAAVGWNGHLADPYVWSKENGFTKITSYKTAPLLGSQHNRMVGQGI